MGKEDLEVLKSCKGSIRLMINSSESENELSDFYIEILKMFYTRSGHTSWKIRNSLKNIRSCKNFEDGNDKYFSFEDESDRLAYIFAYSGLHSVVMHHRFSDMLKSNRSMMKKIIAMKKIKLCILGGGSAFEVVAICKLFNSMLSKSEEPDSAPLEMHVAVVDICSGWEKDAEMIISSAQNNACISKYIKVHFNFIEADLTYDFSEDVKKALKSSHFVTMFKFLSDVSDASYSKSELGLMMNRILECMSYKSCLFFLDNSGGHTFNNMDKYIDGYFHMKRIYGPCLYNPHFLNIESAQKFSNKLHHAFSHQRCTSVTTVSCSAWVKVRDVVNVGKNSLDSIALLNNFEEHKFVEEHKLKEKTRRVRIKKVLQSPVKFKEFYRGDSDKEAENSESD